MRHKLLDVRGIRFILVGGLNSLFGFTVFSLIAYTGGSTWQALLGSTVAGIVFNFFTVGGIVFRDMGLSRVPRFVLAYLGIFWVNLECIEFVSQFLQLHKITTQAILLAPMALGSYLVMSKLVFRSALKA